MTTDTETKKSVELTYDQAVELLDRAVAERGEDYVYEYDEGIGSWSYFHGEEPGCIVGQVLAYAGLERGDLVARGHFGTMDLNEGYAPRNLYQQGVLMADEPTVSLLSIAQEDQDHGMPWGDAVANAKEQTA